MSTLFSRTGLKSKLSEPKIYLWFLTLVAILWLLIASRLILTSASPIGSLLGVGLWVVAAAVCVGVVWVIVKLRAIVAMWRPIALLGVAGVLLFRNDQGKELGVSLLGERNLFPILFLFLALIYWAANTWHTARLGLHDAHKKGRIGVEPSQPSEISKDYPKRCVAEANDRWVYWPPRLLGAVAHLFAAINLALAAWGLPLEAWDRSPWLRLVALTAPAAILLAMVVVWLGDRTWSHRGKKLARKEPIKAKWAWRFLLAAIALEVLLFVVLGWVAVSLKGVPQGFVPSTVSISLSAFAFLIFVSWLRNKRPILGPKARTKRRDQDDRREETQFECFTLGLFAVACLFLVFVWVSPTSVGRLFGSMVVAYFAFGAILAVVNVVELALQRASGLTYAKNLLGKSTCPHVLAAFAISFAIVLGVANAWVHPFHRVRLCDGRDCVGPNPDPAYFVAAAPEKRPHVAEAAKAWYGLAKGAFATTPYARLHPEEPVPMLIVATAGGGIRAAYWTATVLDRLDKDFAEEGGVRPYLFAISGVSGGSVGATAFEAALTKRDESSCEQGDCPPATAYLSQDFLAPALANLVFVDTPSSLLPDLGQDDRGAAIEKSFEEASGQLLSRPFLSFFRYKTDSRDSASAEELAHWWRPILLLNATHEDTGNRMIAGHVLIERSVFTDSFDELSVLKSDIRASTAAHNSARFSYVSPAGDLGNDNGSVIDGGYFENYGALTALEIARAAQATLKRDNAKVKLVFLLISSDPGLDRRRTLARIEEPLSRKDGEQRCLVTVAEREVPLAAGDPNFLTVDPADFESDWFERLLRNAFLNEFIAPLQGVSKGREAHGNRAAAELAIDICTEFPGPTKTGSPQTQAAAAAEAAGNVSLDNSKPMEASPGSPHFAHLAMCDKDRHGKPMPIQPPLGWALSKATQDHFDDLFDACDNGPELAELERALGKDEPPQAANPALSPDETATLKAPPPSAAVAQRSAATSR